MSPAPLALPGSQRTIFFSYGHDRHAGLARQMVKDLRRRGHVVWFDESLRTGNDWEHRIEEGLQRAGACLDRGRFVLLMTPHAVRRPDGYCLNELASTLRRGLSVLPVMVEDCEPPLSICRLQYLDLRDCVPWPERGERYAAKFDLLCRALEGERPDFEGTQARLLRYLRPLEFDADFECHLPRFTGRRWVFERLDAWLGEPGGSRIFWITAAPGVGKTALATWMCAKRPDILAFHLCRHGDAYKTEPRRVVLSLAYQLASQLPDYADRLTGVALEELTADAGARTLFDALITQPLGKGYSAPPRPVLVVIDALDEATRDGRNELAELLGSEWGRTPPWLRLVLTSRPAREVSFPLQALTPNALSESLPDNRADLRAYLARELRPFSPGQEVAPAVLEARSEGSFLYAEWVREELAQGRLSLERVEQVPQGLGGAYAAFFARQFTDAGEYEEKIAPVLELIGAAREPLEVALLRALLGRGEREWRRLAGKLGSLFPVRDGKIRAFHKSALDWLTSEKAGDYWLDSNAGERRLSEEGWRLYREGAAKLPGYFVRHLPAHLVEHGREKLVALLTDFDYAMTCCANDPTALLESYRSATRALGTSAGSLSVWQTFFTERLHVLQLGEPAWPAEHILVQLALEHADTSPLTGAAQAWLARGHCSWPCLRRKTLPADFAPAVNSLVIPRACAIAWSGPEVLTVLTDEERIDVGCGPPIEIRSRVRLSAGAPALPGEVSIGGREVPDELKADDAVDLAGKFPWRHEAWSEGWWNSKVDAWYYRDKMYMIWGEHESEPSGYKYTIVSAGKDALILVSSHGYHQVHRLRGSDGDLESRHVSLPQGTDVVALGPQGRYLAYFSTDALQITAINWEDEDRYEPCRAPRFTVEKSWQLADRQGAARAETSTGVVWLQQTWGGAEHGPRAPPARGLQAEARAGLPERGLDVPAPAVGIDHRGHRAGRVGGEQVLVPVRAGGVRDEHPADRHQPLAALAPVPAPHRRLDAPPAAVPRDRQSGARCRCGRLAWGAEPP